MLMPKILTPSQLQAFYMHACMAEIEALKPGNVHIFADGHGMTVQDFILSAEASAPAISAPNISLGERILNSVQATQQAVHCNTNLGIILLCAPIIQAALLPSKVSLQQKLNEVLANTTQQDADCCFRAIALASPAGLGESQLHDVNKAADCTLLEAMQFAAERDFIAKQYAHGFADIFNFGLAAYKKAQAAGYNTAWSTTFVYLALLAEHPDSHIVRKYGKPLAVQAQRQASAHLAGLQQATQPKLYQKNLLDWDAKLKEEGINPGTSADMTVALLLVAKLLNL